VYATSGVRYSYWFGLKKEGGNDKIMVMQLHQNRDVIFPTLTGAQPPRVTAVAFFNENSNTTKKQKKWFESTNNKVKKIQIQT
jgi:hypothetical protein